MNRYTETLQYAHKHTQNENMFKDNDEREIKRMKKSKQYICNARVCSCLYHTLCKLARRSLATVSAFLAAVESIKYTEHRILSEETYDVFG